MTHITSFSRVVCLLLVCLVLWGAIVVPVSASALLYQFLSVMAENLLASIIRGCGVYVADGINDTLSDGLSAWDDLVSYVYQHLPESVLYSKALIDTGFNLIMKDGLYYADRNLVKYVLEFLTGPREAPSDSNLIIRPIGYGFDFGDAALYEYVNNAVLEYDSTGNWGYSALIRGLERCYVFEYDHGSDTEQLRSPLVIFTNSAVKYTCNNDVLTVTIPAGQYVMIYNDYGTNAQPMSGSPTSSRVFEIKISGDVTQRRFRGKPTIDLEIGVHSAPVDSLVVDSIPTEIDTAWDSSSVTVTDKRLSGSVTAVPVSVSSDISSVAVAPKADVISGTRVDADVIVKEGLATGTETGTETGTVSFWNKLWGWLEKIWTAIKSLVTGITTPIVNAISAVRSKVASLADVFSGTVVVASPLEAIHFGALFDLFPFNIPYGIYKAITLWGSTAAAPTVTIPLPTYKGGSMDIYKFEINFSEIPGMDKLAAVIRAGELILFVLGLAMVTRKVTKW